MNFNEIFISELLKLADLPSGFKSTGSFVDPEGTRRWNWEKLPKVKGDVRPALSRLHAHLRGRLAAKKFSALGRKPDFEEVQRSPLVQEGRTDKLLAEPFVAAKSAPTSQNLSFMQKLKGELSGPLAERGPGLFSRLQKVLTEGKSGRREAVRQLVRRVSGR